MEAWLGEPAALGTARSGGGEDWEPAALVAAGPVEAGLKELAALGHVRR